jgi:hypothetical protein
VASATVSAAPCQSSSSILKPCPASNRRCRRPGLRRRCRRRRPSAEARGSDPALRYFSPKRLRNPLAGRPLKTRVTTVSTSVAASRRLRYAPLSLASRNRMPLWTPPRAPVAPGRNEKASFSVALDILPRLYENLDKTKYYEKGVRSSRNDTDTSNLTAKSQTRRPTDLEVRNAPDGAHERSPGHRRGLLERLLWTNGGL